MRTLKILSLLLSYPSALPDKVWHECRELLRQERWLSSKTLAHLEQFIQARQTTDLLDQQEQYVYLFDRNASLSLHLFEHIHGDSRERGQALVDLLHLYQQTGLTPNRDELPDYLPLFLEYLSTQTAKHIKENLASIVNILAAIRQRLAQRASNYATIFEALLEISQQTPDARIVQSAQQGAEDEDDLAAIDQAWEEPLAFETPTLGSTRPCSMDSSQHQIVMDLSIRNRK